MKPYYQDASVTLYHGDCRELAPALGLRADAVYADPPYGETSLDWDRWPGGWVDVAQCISAQMWCFGSMRMFTDHWAAFAAWQFAQEVIWKKHNGSNPGKDRFRRVHEFALHFYRGDWSSVYKEQQFTNDATAKVVRRKVRPPQWGDIGSSVFTSEDGGPKQMTSVIEARSCHGYAINETQKPEDLVAPLVRYSVPPGGLLVSLFAGSGTDLIVARKTGRRAIGFEKRESQCEAAAARLSQLELEAA